MIIYSSNILLLLSHQLQLMVFIPHLVAQARHLDTSTVSWPIQLISKLCLLLSSSWSPIYFPEQLLESLVTMLPSFLPRLHAVKSPIQTYMSPSPLPFSPPIENLSYLIEHWRLRANATSSVRLPHISKNTWIHGIYI